MKRITVFLFLVFFALWTGQSQTVSKTAISNQKVNSTKSVAVLDSQMENKVGNSQSNQSNAAIDELLARVESLGTQVENVTEFFTTSEIQQLRAHFQQARGFNVHPVYEVRSDNNAYGINNAIPSFGSFNHLAPAGTFTPLSGGSGTAGFEGAGAIDPANPSVGYAMDIDGFLYQVNVDTGVYTNLGNTGILEVNGMAFNPVDGTLYAITGTSVYTVDPSVSSLTLVGVHGIPGTFAIALGISDDGVGYTYDISLDQLFSINLSTGVATLIGNIGFDANFGQGMDWDPATGTMYMAAFNLTSFNTEIRSVNLTTGATTLIGYIDTVNLVQMGWVSFVGSSGGGGGDCSSPTVDINQDQENTCMATISQQGIAQSFTAESPMSAGAGLKFNGPVSGGQVLEIYLYDELPTNGGVVLASGSTTTAGGETWVDVFWTTAASTAVGDMYYLVFEGTVTTCISGTTFDSYAGGHLYANAGYTPFPDWDYTFRHYGCEGGGGGGDCEPGNITTIFTGGNQFAGNMFDITASGGEDIQIESFDINMDSGSGLISVYYKPGSYIGFESDASAWTLLGAETVVSMGENNPTPLNVGGLTIPAGETYGIYISSTDYTTNNFTMNYTNGDFNYTDAYMTIETGVGKGNPDFTGSTFGSRSWNGTVYYCAGEGGGGGDCSSPVVDINQDESNTCMAYIDQAGIAQSFTAESDTSAGAGFMFTTDVAAGQALQIGLWDNLPNSGGVLMASGSVTTAGGDAWVDVFWTDPASTTIGDMYYLVVEGTVGECIAGTTYDSYPGGNVYANSGYTPFPNYDYTFRHYGCEGGGGGGDECTFETLSNGVEDGTPNSLYGTANDFIVPADETFMMEQVVVPILTSPGTTILYADLTYFDNSASNLPGATLGSENGITPTSQDIIGSAFGYDVREVVLDITPFTFEAGATDTNFWVQVHTPNSGGSATYWESNTSGPVLGYPTAGFDGAVWSHAWGSNYDGVFQYNGDCSGSGGGGPVGDCDEENARVGVVFDGLNCSIGGGFKVANDITVPADFDFHLEQIRANILSIGDITEVNVVYYDNSTSNLPGTQIASEMGVVPTSQTVVGSAFGYDVIEITLDIPTYIFAGQMGSTTTYWIGLEVNNVSSSSSIFWEVTDENAVGYATALNTGSWSIWNPSADGVYLWGGNCEPVIVNSEEAPLIGFSYYPNPTSDVIYLQADQIIDSVDLYNVLGQQVLSQSVNAQSSQLDVSGLAAGTYLMSVESEGTLHTYQVIKK